MQSTFCSSDPTLKLPVHLAVIRKWLHTKHAIFFVSHFATVEKFLKQIKFSENPRYVPLNYCQIPFPVGAPSGVPACNPSG